MTEYVAGTWYPISEAPKDGTCILAFGPADADYEQGMGVIWFEDEPGCFIEGDLGPVSDGYYTHFSPLPKPPKTET